MAVALEVLADLKALGATEILEEVGLEQEWHQKQGNQVLLIISNLATEKTRLFQKPTITSTDYLVIALIMQEETTVKVCLICIDIAIITTMVNYIVTMKTYNHGRGDWNNEC